MKWCLTLALAGLLGAAAADPVHIVSAVTAYEAGQRALKLGQSSEAISDFQQAIEIEPTYVEALTGLIGSYRSSGNNSETAAAITRLLEIQPDATNYRLILAQTLLTQNETRRALAQFSLVLRAEPLNAEALFGFASAAHKAGMDDRAAEALERGRKQYPRDPRFQRDSAQR